MASHKVNGNFITDLRFWPDSNGLSYSTYEGALACSVPFQGSPNCEENAVVGSDSKIYRSKDEPYKLTVYNEGKSASGEFAIIQHDGLRAALNGINNLKGLIFYSVYDQVSGGAISYVYDVNKKQNIYKTKKVNYPFGSVSFSQNQLFGGVVYRELWGTPFLAMFNMEKAPYPSVVSGYEVAYTKDSAKAGIVLWEPVQVTARVVTNFFVYSTDLPINPKKYILPTIGYVMSSAFSVDGSMIALGGEGFVTICKFPEMEKITDISGVDWVRKVAFSPDGKLVAAATDNPFSASVRIQVRGIP